LLLTLAAACNQSSKQSGKDSGGNNDGASTGAGTDAAADGSSSDGSAASSSSADQWENGYYTGFNGKDKFSLYLPSFRPMTVSDPSIAKIEGVSVTLSSTTIDELVADRKNDDPNFDDAKMREMLAKPRTVYKLTPLKAGKTTLKTTGAGKGPSGSAWKSGQSTVLVVTAYSTDQVEKGKARYTREGDGNKKACASCHETGANGAPPHELGDIMSIPDASAEQWITTGKLADREASIPHTWEFDSQDEELGTVAYLRTLQTDDLETLTKLEFENQAGPPPGGPGGP
jgi:mono/diheme cytochrome c family protein